jgi:hypothetical protein
MSNANAKPRYEVRIPIRGEWFEFFSIAGAHQWLENEKAEGRTTLGASIYDNETKTYIIAPQIHV